jgi:hypothetical protein
MGAYEKFIDHVTSVVGTDPGPTVDTACKERVGVAHRGRHQHGTGNHLACDGHRFWKTVMAIGELEKITKIEDLGAILLECSTYFYETNDVPTEKLMLLAGAVITILEHRESCEERKELPSKPPHYTDGLLY